MNQTEKNTDRGDLQRRVLHSELYREVIATEEAIRCRFVGQYDSGTAEDRRFAILCYALEQSAERASGTSINLAGVYRTLHNLKQEAL